MTFFSPACSSSSGNRSGNRRTANIRSIGHSDLFSLSKEDLTDVLSEFPAAKRHLEEKGRQILTKMGMLEVGGGVEEGQEEKTEAKILRLESMLEDLLTKLARLMVELESSDRKLRARVERLEEEVEARVRAAAAAEGEGGDEGAGRGEGVGGEVAWEREEAEGEEEEETSNGVMKTQGQKEDCGDVTKEGDGESTKEEVEKLVEVNLCREEERRSEGRGDDRPGKGDGAEIQPGETGQEEEGVQERKE